MAKFRKAAEDGLCGICGQANDGPYALVGGPESIESHTFGDLPMHEDCARYALQVCPFLAAPRARYHRKQIEGEKTHSAMAKERPEVFGLGLTDEYAAGVDASGEWWVRAREWKSIKWWRNGVASPLEQLPELTKKIEE
jgi:hypothetical protein